MIQRSDRETRVLIVEGINPDKSEEDYSRKFQVHSLHACMRICAVSMQEWTCMHRPPAHQYTQNELCGVLSA